MSNRTVTAALGATLVALGAALPGVAPASATSAATGSAPLVVLLNGHVARTRPSLAGHRIEYVASLRPLTHVRTVLPVIGRLTRGGQSWVHVRLPGRPNGHTGWVRGGQTRPASTAWAIRVDLSARRVTVTHGGHVSRRFRAIVGAPSTPTPRGRFFVEEALALSPGAHGGPFALATSARSNVLQQFDGGPGQIALHGTNHLPGTLGSAASHGCIRLSPRAISWLAHRIAGGTPLTITR